MWQYLKSNLEAQKASKSLKMQHIVFIFYSTSAIEINDILAKRYMQFANLINKLIRFLISGVDGSSQRWNGHCTSKNHLPFYNIIKVVRHNA
jgi:hypothetical protein